MKTLAYLLYFLVIIFSNTEAFCQQNNLSLHLSTSTATHVNKEDCRIKADVHLSQLEAFYLPAPVFTDLMRNEIQTAQLTTARQTSGQIIAYNNLSYKATLSSGEPLPGWIDYLPIDHAFVGMPHLAVEGTFKIIFTATNGASEQSTTVKIHVHK